MPRDGNLKGPELRRRRLSWLRSILVTFRPLRLHLLILAVVWGATQTSQFADAFGSDTAYWILPTTLFYIIFLGTAFRLTAMSETIQVQSFCTIILLGTAFFVLLLGFTPHLIPALTVIPDEFTEAMFRDWSSHAVGPDRLSSNFWFGMFVIYVVSLGMVGRSARLPQNIRPETSKSIGRCAVISLLGLMLYDYYLLHFASSIAPTLRISILVSIAFLLVLVDICSGSDITDKQRAESWDALPQMKAWSVWLTPFQRVARLASKRISPWLSVTMLIILPVLMLLFFAVSGAASRVSVPSLIVLEASIWLLILTELQGWSKRLDLPIITLLLLWGLLLSVLGWNYRHKVRLIVRLPTTRTEKVQDIFADWIANRKDMPTDQTQPYPVVLLAAEGGGIRAAYSTALLLELFKEKYPELLHHLFAISAVSGGSIGVAYFAASNKVTLEGDIADASLTRFFSQDYLSAPLADLLGAELLQRIFPTQLPLLTGKLKALRRFGIDRAAAAEVGFENAFKRITGSSAFESDFCTVFDASGDSPLLLFNATDAYTGQRVVLTPACLLNDKNAVYPVQETPSLHLRLSTAAMLGARFPLISPAGELTTGSHRRLELVDGGYVDNTGTETLGALLRELVNAIHNGACKRRISLIVVTPKYYGDSLQNDKTPNGSFEILPIIAALVNSRDRLSASAERIALTMQAMGPDIPYACVEIPLTSTFREQPLGWKLSADAQWDLLVQLQKAAHRKDPGLRQIAIWPPDRVNLREAYVQSLRSSTDIIEGKYPAVEHPNYGNALLAFTQISSIRASDLPKFMPWCDVITRPNGEQFQDVSKDIVDAVNAIRSARNLVMDISSLDEADESDVAKMIIRLAHHHISADLKKYLNYAKFAESLTINGMEALTANDSMADRYWPYNERCQMRWAEAARRYRKALQILSVAKTEDRMKTQGIVQSELTELRNMYKERWPGMEPFTTETE
jgi:predicted acylesterase/phospholipase RssA